MTRQNRIGRRGFLKGGAALGLATALAPRFSVAADGKVLRLRSYSDLQVLDPAFMLSAPEGDIIRTVLRSLVRRKSSESWGWELDAAESVEQVDDTHIKFTLKKGIMWSNGFGELTAEDIKYSYERIADPKLESPYKDDWATLDYVEVTDSHSGVIVLKEYFAPLWSTTLPEISGTIVCKAAVEKAGGKFTTEFPAMAGPYVVKEWVPKQKTVLARNPDYAGDPAPFNEIHILPIEDEKAAEIGYEAGDLDFTGISISSLPNYKSKMPLNSKLTERPSLAYVWISMNVEHPNYQDIKVRQAVQLAIDCDAILQAAYFGVAERATGIVAPGMIGHREKNLVTRDVEKAKALLEEAGKSGGFQTTISVLNKAERLAVAQVIQANLAEIGVEVQINSYDSGTFWTLGDQASGETYKTIELMLNRFSMNPDPSWATVWFTPEQIGVWNWERWNSPEFGELHKQALVEKDEAKRDVMYKQMQDLMEQSGAYIFLTHELSPRLYRDNIEPGLMPDGQPIFSQFKLV